MDKQNWQDVQRYFEGEMDDLSRDEFETRLKADDELSELVDLYMATHTVIVDKGRKNWLTTIPLVGNENIKVESDANDKNHKSISWKSKWILITLIAILGLYFIYYLISLKSGTKNNEKSIKREEPAFYADNFTPLPGLPVTLSETGLLSFSEGMIQYRKHNFNQAIEYFTASLKDGNNSDTLKIYLANSLIQIDDYNSAKIYLDEIIESNSSRYLPDANWFKAKIYLLVGYPDSARIVLNHLISFPNEYNDRAEDVLKDLLPSNQ